MPWLQVVYFTRLLFRPCQCSITFAVAVVVAVPCALSMFVCNVTRIFVVVAVYSKITFNRRHMLPSLSFLWSALWEFFSFLIAMFSQIRSMYVGIQYMTRCLWRPISIVLIVCIWPSVLCNGKITQSALSRPFCIFLISH